MVAADCGREQHDVMVEPDDWRVGQHEYLKGISLVFKAYTTYSPTWDHDHCYARRETR